MTVEIILVIILGGLCALDKTEAYQTMLSQPLVIGGIVGLLLKDLHAGIKIGILIQLVYFWVVPIGTAIFPDPAVGGVVGTFGYIVLLRFFPNRADSVLFFNLLYIVAFSFFAGWTLIKQRQLNLRLIQKADLYAEKGEVSKINKLFFWALFGSFGRGVILTALGIVGVLILVRPIMGFSVSLPEHYLKGIEISFVGFGIGTMFHYFGKRKNLLWLGLGLSLGIVFILI